MFGVLDFASPTRPTRPMQVITIASERRRGKRSARFPCKPGARRGLQASACLP